MSTKPKNPSNCAIKAVMSYRPRRDANPEEALMSQGRRPFGRRRKSCPFSGANAVIDYKDTLLQRYVSERGKIVRAALPLFCKKQRELAAPLSARVSRADALRCRSVSRHFPPHGGDNTSQGSGLFCSRFYLRSCIHLTAFCGSANSLYRADHGANGGALTAGLASVLLGALASSGTALNFIISFGVPILWLIRLALLSRRQSLDTDYEFYPAAQIILQAVIISAALAALIFGQCRCSQGLPGMFAQNTKPFRSFRIDPHSLWHRHKSFWCRQYYSDHGVCHGRYFAGHLQCPKRLPNTAVTICAPPKRMTG